MAGSGMLLTRYRNSVHYRFNNSRISHSCNPSGFPDIRRNLVESHDGYRTCFFGYERLFRGGNIHYDTPFLHTGKASFYEFCTESEFFKLHKC